MIIMMMIMTRKTEILHLRLYWNCKKFYHTVWAIIPAWRLTIVTRSLWGLFRIGCLANEADPRTNGYASVHRKTVKWWRFDYKKASREHITGFFYKSLFTMACRASLHPVIYNVIMYNVKAICLRVCVRVCVATSTWPSVPHAWPSHMQVWLNGERATDALAYGWETERSAAFWLHISWESSPICGPAGRIGVQLIMPRSGDDNYRPSLGENFYGGAACSHSDLPWSYILRLWLHIDPI